MWTAVMPLDVNADIGGLVLTINAGGQVSGRVRAENGHETDLTEVTVSIARRNGAGERAEVQANGTFSVKDLEPASYIVELLGLPDGFYAKSVQCGSVDIRDSGLQVTAQGKGPLEIVVGGGRGA